MANGVAYVIIYKHDGPYLSNRIVIIVLMEYMFDDGGLEKKCYVYIFSYFPDF